MKLGIVVVYYLKDSDLSLLQLHLSKIYKHTKTNFEIFAGNNGLQPAAKDLLEKTPHLKIYNPPVKQLINLRLRLNLHHQVSKFTDYLVQKAAEAGSNNIVIMHPDSFPVCDGWDLVLAERLSDKYVLSAILRKENYDTVLTFPACIFFTAYFYLDYKPSMIPVDSYEYKEFLTTNNQVADCGIGYSFTLHQAGLCWHPLLRSNQIDEHPIVGGIYGDLIFHLGGGSRKKLYYRKDRLQTNDKVKRKEMATVNMNALEETKQRLTIDPDAYLNYLRFGEEK